MIARGLALAFALLADCTAPAAMKWPDLLSRPHPVADARIRYGADTLQHVDLWRPPGKGPFPVVLMIHGGCWQTGIAEADIMDWIAADLRERGIAVWNIDYRGVDRAGGGYPGTFRDVAAAADALRSHAARYRLDLSRVVAVGHSAGGHLALWQAARRGLARSSPLAGGHPVTLRAAISLGGLPDVEAAAVPPGNTCGSEAVEKLVGASRPDPYSDTSPARLPPPRIPMVLVNGEEDRIAPPPFAAAYAARMAAGGAPVERITVPREGHVELIAPESMAWRATVRRIEAAVR